LIIPVTIPDDLVIRIPSDDLPGRWFSHVIVAQTQLFGDRWIADGQSAVLEVPCAVTNEEHNYLLNPSHPDFKLITIEDAMPFRIDPRLE